MNPLSLDYLHNRSQATWLIGIDNQRVLQLTEALYQQLHQRGKFNFAPRILLLEANAVNFLAGFFATVATGYPLFLGNPQWTTSEQYRVLELIQPDVILTEGCWNEPPVFAARADDQSIRHRETYYQASDPVNMAGCIMIPTGGSSGRIQFAIHTWETLTASVQGFQQHIGVDRINSYCVLPLHHVSGLMQCLRAYLSGGCLAWQPYKHLVDGQVLKIDPHDWFISLVPTQLQRLLDQDRSISTGNTLTAWLRQFRAVLVGGAPLWSALGERARKLGLPLAPTYGMTETASQVATLMPSEFLVGKAGVGRSLPHAQITIQDTSGQPLPTGAIGTIAIHATSLFLGYYPLLASEPNGQSYQPLPSTGYLTDDLGFLDQNGYLQIVGRNSSKVITGGENVFPAEVEAALLATGLVAEVCVLGQPDRQWGEAVTAVYVPTTSTVTVTQLRDALRDRLSPYKQPKHWIAVTNLPRNAQGKLNLAQIRQIVLRERALVTVDQGMLAQPWHKGDRPRL